MIWYVILTSVIVLLQILYLGLIRRDVELGFKGQDASMARFGAELAGIRKKGDKTSYNTDYLEQRISKLEVELDQFRVLTMKLMADRMEDAERKAKAKAG